MSATGLQTWLGRWGCAEPDGSVNANRESQAEWETFTVEPQADGTVALRTFWPGRYLCAEPDGRLTSRVPGTEDATPGPWECFRVERLGETAVAFETNHGTYVCAEPDYRLIHRWPGTTDRFPGVYETFEVAPWWTATSPRHRVPAGRVRLNGAGLLDDTGAFLGAVVSYFHGPRTFERDRARFDADVATMQDANADGARVITDLGWPGDREQDGPGRIDRLLATMDALWTAGLRTQVTVLGSLFGSRYLPDGSVEWRTLPYRLDSQEKRRRYADALGAVFKGREHQILLLEICNEPENGGVGPLSRDDQAELQRFIKARLPGVLVALGAPGGEGGATTWNDADYSWYGQHGDLVLPHLDRGGRDMGYGVAHQGIHSAQASFPWGDNEPIGPGSSVRSETDATKLRLCRTGAWMTRAAFGCFHPYSGIGLGRDSDYPIRQEPGILTAFAARAVLPPDLANFAFHNWHWDSNPLETLDGCYADHPDSQRGTIRTLGLTRGRDRVLWLLKIAPRGSAFRPRESMRLTEWRFENDRYISLGERDYPRGEAFELGPAEDVLYTGVAL